MAGELASWDLCFATIKFCTCRLHPLRGHTPPASAALAGQGPICAPVQPAVSHRAAGRSLHALASQVGSGGGHLLCSSALVSRDGLWAPSSRRGWLVPDVQFPKLSLCLAPRDAKAEAVPAACAADARLNLRESGPATTSPRPSGSPAHCGALQSWRRRLGSPAAPPRGCRAGSGPPGPGRASDHADSSRAPSPTVPASASSSTPSQVQEGCGELPGPPRP